MFTPAERERIRADLLAFARADPRITAAALTGSASVGREDRFSDIDLALRITGEPAGDAVLGEVTGRMYRTHGAVHHLDVFRGVTRYRVFLLANTLQVDIAFFADTDFGATAPTFRLLFGTAHELPHTPAPDPVELAAWGWLYALHARASIGRERVWQAEYMISGLRGSVLAMACLRHGVPAVEGRGMDDLPAGVRAEFRPCLPASLAPAELRRAFACCAGVLHTELSFVDTELAGRLAGPIRELAV